MGLKQGLEGVWRRGMERRAEVGMGFLGVWRRGMENEQKLEWEGE